MKNLAQRVAILVFVATIVLLLSACGGGHSGGSIAANPITVTLVQSGTATTVYAGSAAVALTAAVANDTANAGVTWSLSPATGCGTLTVPITLGMNAVYAPPAKLGADCTASITVTSAADGGVTAAVKFTVKATLSIAQSGTTTTVNAGGAAVILTAPVANDTANAGVTWSLNPATGCGTLTGSATTATYTPPAESSLNADCNATIIATSVTDPANSSGIVFTLKAVAIALGGESTTPVVTANAPVPLSLSASIVNDASGSATLNWSLSSGSSPAVQQIGVARPSLRNVSTKASPIGPTISNCGTLSASSGTAVTYTPPTVGPCTATVTVSTSVNPNVTQTFKITVNAQPAVTVTLGCTPVTYDGNAHNCTATPIPAGASCTGLVPETNAGSYSEGVTCSLAGYLSGSATATFIINPATPTLSLTCGTVFANGSPQACAPGGTATGIGGASVAGTFSYAYNGSATAPSAAATYGVVATFASGNTNYASGGTASGSFVINPQPLVTVALGCTPVTYDGNTHNCTATPTPAGASCTGLVSETNAGSYPESVTCSLTGYVSGAATGTLAINPATPVLSASCPGGVYTGSPYACTGSATGVGGAAVGGSFAFAPGSETNVGNYPETGAFTSTNTNYISGGTATATLGITMATQSPSVSCPGPLTFDGNAHSCTITGGFGTCTSASVTNVPGSSTLALSCTGDSNHNPYSGTGSITINPAAPTLSLTCGTVLADGSPHACAPGGTATGIGGASVAGTFSYTYNGSTTVPSAVATYSVVATFASGNSNYASGGTASGSFKIGIQQVVTVTLVCTPATFDGNAHSCTATPNPAGASCTGLVSETNAGTYPESVTCGFTGYEPGSNTGSLVINPATPTLSASCPGGVYTGSPYACTGSATGIGGAAVNGSFAFAPGSETNAGSYPETGTFTSTDTNYVSGGTASGTLVITAATPTLSATCTGGVYSGTAYSCTGSATGVGGATVAGSFAFAPGSKTNAGSYPETGTFTSTDTNYVSGGTASGSLVITQATPTLSATCTGGVSDGTAYSCTGLATGVGGAVVSGSFAFTPGSETAVGSYPETGTFTSSDPNYASGGTASGTLTITGAVYTVSGQISLLNGAGALPGATVSLGGGLTATTDVNGNFTISNVPAGSYTLAPTYTFPAGSDPADSSVFYPASQSLTVSGDLTGQNFTAEVGYTVYGTVQYAGTADPTNVSQLYVNMRNTVCGSCSPNGTSLVFEMPGPYQFTIHGVTPGAYTLQSWFDLSGYGAPNIGDPISSGYPVTVSIATGDVTMDPNADVVTLNDPASWPDLTSLPAPTLTVSPALDKGVIVYYQSIMSAGVEQATRYNLCWSSITGGGGDSDCQLSHPTKGGALSMNNSDAFWEDSGTGKIVILDGGDTSSIFYTKSPTSYRPVDGSLYSFCLQGVNGNEVGGNWNCQHATLAAPPTSSPAGTSTLVMSVKTPVKATGAVYSGCYDPVGNALYVHTDESKPAAGTHSYTVYGIPSSVANCNVVAAMDQNNDGFLTPLDPDAGSLFGGLSGDIFNLGRNNTLTALTVGGSTTAPLLDLTPYHQNSSATLTTQNNLDPNGVESYSVNFDVRPLMRMPAGVELTSGLNVLQTIDFAPGCATCGQGEFNVTVSTANQAPGGNYTLAVSDESTAAAPVTDTPTLAVSNVVGDFATNLSATGGATPTFTWSYPVNNTSAYTYQFTLWDASGNVIWQVPAKTGTGFSSTAVTVIAWPNDPTGATNPPAGSLTSGHSYTWALTTIDSNGNTAQQKATYIP